MYHSAVKQHVSPDAGWLKKSNAYLSILTYFILLKDQMTTEIMKGINQL